MISPTPILSAQNLGKTYVTPKGDTNVALRGCTLDTQRGEFVSLVGPSGCGKTTLLKMFAGLLKPTTGSLRFYEKPGGLPPGAFGIVFQSHALLPWRTVLRNVLLPADILRIDDPEIESRASELLELMGIGGTEHKYPSELSGGMQQRASIARALLTDPEVLLMDEPFGALDAMTREELNLELQRVHLKQEKTVVFVTHSISEAVMLSDRIAVMTPGPGRIAQVLDVKLERPRTPKSMVSPEARQVELDVRQVLNDAIAA